MATKPSLPPTMKAWQMVIGGGAMEKSMQMKDDVPLPNVKQSSNQYLIKVSHMALNPVDYKLGEVPLLGRLLVAQHASPGLDYAGRVVSSPSDTGNSIPVGTLVFGRRDQPYGALAEYILASSEGTVSMPEEVDPAQAAALGTAALTAYQSIVPYVSAGNRVFINGGSGGCGSFGIQVAKALGCHVTATCSTANVELCKELGADEVLDYKTTDIVSSLSKTGSQSPFDLVVDNVDTTNDLYENAHKFLRPSGKYVQVGVYPSFSGLSRLLSRLLRPSLLGGGKRSIVALQVKNKKKDFEQLMEWVRQGKVRPRIERVYAFEEARSAYERLRTGRTKGKLVIRVAN